MNITRAECAERAKLIHGVDYAVLVDVTPATARAGGKDPDEVFWSHTTISFESGIGASFVNLIAAEVSQLLLDDNPLPATAYGDGKVSFAVPAGKHQLSVGAWCRYSHTGEGLHRFTDPADGLTYLYTQFETADARRMYACFEQPDLKATFALTVNTPPNWRVFSNSETPKANRIGAKAIEHVFGPSPLLSSYLTCLVAGPYHLVRDSYPGIAAEIPLGLACRRSLKQYLDAERLFGVTKAGFQVFEKAFGQPYPFAKYDQVFVPEFNFGAMENAGCIVLRDEYLFRSKTTQAAYESRDNTVLHEMAHMWFGDLVTMKWWDDLWLNESFAEWASHWCQGQIAADAGLREVHGSATASDPWVTFANNRKNWAYRQDQLPSTHPIAADMVDLEAVELNFDGITYAKGASVLKQLVAFVGEDAFLAGLRAYFAKHAWSNTTFDDLLAALSAASGRDLSGFAAQWLQTTGPNTLSAELEVDAQGKLTRLGIRQTGATLRDHRMAIGWYEGDAGLVRTHRVELDVSGELTEVPEAVGLPRPALLLLNDDDLSYAKVRLDDVSLATAIERIAAIESPLARALCWGAAWDMCRDAELPAAGYLDLVLGAVASESDLTGVQTILNQARTAIDFYSPRPQRRELLELYNEMCWRMAKEAEDGSDHQLALFRAFVSSVPGGAAERISFLEGCLAGTEGLPGLAIDTDLRWRIVTQLAQLGIFTDEQIAAEAQRDLTAQGAEKAAGARAAQPTAAAKAAAWEAAVVRDDTPNETHAQICGQFWQFDQDEVLSDYLEKYLETAQAISAGTNGWPQRSSAIRQHVLGLLFPRPLLDRAKLDTVNLWFAGNQLSDSVKRQVSERIDDAERALRCQAAS
jgi:aminopeptidase N